MADFDLNALMQQMQTMQADIKKTLEATEVTGAAGGGMVVVKATGAHRILSVEIDPTVLGEDKEMLQDLVTAAVNSALEKAQEAAAKHASTLIPPGMVPPGGLPGLG